VRQFGHRRGIAGQVADWVMAHRHSNRQRNRWAVALLEVRPTDRVFEIGFGPGLAIAELAGRATHGHRHGIDHSAVMVRRAGRHNHAAIHNHQVERIALVTQPRSPGPRHHGPSRPLIPRPAHRGRLRAAPG
jgi:tRNA G46 methylase TrmB